MAGCSFVDTRSDPMQTFRLPENAVKIHSTHAGKTVVALYRVGDQDSTKFVVQDGTFFFEKDNHEEAAHSYGRAIMRNVS